MPKHQTKNIKPLQRMGFLPDAVDVAGSREVVKNNSDHCLTEALHRVTHGLDFLAGIGAGALVARFETDFANRSIGRLEPARQSRVQKN